MLLDDDALNELRLGAITAIDGLWFLAAEKKLGFEEAFKLDLDVWRAYGLVQLRRIQKATGMSLDPGDPPALETINELLEALCAIDGTECSWTMEGPARAVFKVVGCPWWDNLKRSGREKLVNCELVDNEVFFHWLKALDPNLSFEISCSMPRGDEYCEWILKRG